MLWYIQLNPVREEMFEKPSEYQWSNFAKKAEGISGPVVDHHQIYNVLGNSAPDLRKTHQEIVFETIPDEELILIRDSIQRNQVTGGNRF